MLTDLLFHSSRLILLKASSAFPVFNSKGKLASLPRRALHFDLHAHFLQNFLGDDTLVPGLRRYIVDDPIRVTVTAGGENLSEYMYLNELNGASLTDENINTHINGGYGVFDSRMTTTRTLRLGGTTVPELVENTKWGFKFIGGHLEK